MRRVARVAVLASHPVQYFTPLYKRLAAHPAIDLEVLFCRDFGVRAQYDKQFGQSIAWDTDQLEGYSHRFLQNLSPVSDTFNPLHAINPGAFTRLLRGFDAVWMNGYMYPSNWFAAGAARLSGTHILLRSELRLAPDRIAKRTDRIRDAMIRRWVRWSDALLYIGEENRRAYLHYGADAGKLFFSPYSADVAVMRAALSRASCDPGAARAQLGLPAGATIASFVGKLTARKHPEAVLELAADARLRDDLHVVIAGSGPMEGELRARAARDGLTNVTFLGFVNQSRLPDIYAVSDLFVMPSEREPWGIVLNEAMAAGAVPVVSDAVGAAPDLIRQRETGLAFPSGDWGAMRECVLEMVGNPSLREAMGARAVERAEAYSHDAAASGVVDALRALGHVSHIPGNTLADAG